MQDIQSDFMFIGFGKRYGRHQSVKSLFEFKHEQILLCAIFHYLTVDRATPVPILTKKKNPLKILSYCGSRRGNLS